MKNARSKLSYANLTSTLCLFLLLAGGSAYAATQVAKDSIGTPQLKKNSVATGKIRDGAVTGPKIDMSSLGTVPSATHANSADSATTAETAIRAGSATKADSATQADTAIKADSATRADSASKADSAVRADTATEADLAATATKADTATSAGTAASADVATTAESLAAPEAVHRVGTSGEPPFESGFGNKLFGGAAAGFYKDRACFVHLVGQVEGPSANLVFTLPVSYRPAQEVFAAIAAAGPKAANLQVQPSGFVIAAQAGGGTGAFGLDGVSFLAATC
jgi:hypothetical protein